MSVTGFSDTTKIDVYWKRADEPMNSATGWNIITGTYNFTTKTFSGSFSTSNEPTEIIVTANVFDSVGFYTGNPAFSNCVHGAYGRWIDNQFQLERCHDGFQKFMAIDPLRTQINQLVAGGNNILDSYIDTKSYLKFEPGYYWEFDGVNFTYNQNENNRTFHSRIEAEKPVVVLNKHRVVPLRFTKDKTSGYIAPKHKYEIEDSGWNGPFANRWMVTAFSSDSRWTDFYIGALDGKGYSLATPNPFSTLGAQSPQGNVYFSDLSQHRYYPPYMLAPRYLPLGDPSFWSFNRKDTIYSVRPDANWNLLDQTENYNDAVHGWTTQYAWENVVTPVYSGRALRIKFQENDGRPPEVSGFLREDWFFAPNIGLVMIREKNFKPGPCDDTCLNKPMLNPELEMKLVKYYAGQILQFSANATTLHYGDTLTYQVSQNYTGYIEISGTLPTRILWVENGHASLPVDSTIPLGTHRLKVRRVIPQQPANSNHEVLDSQFTNTLPFSNELTLNFAGNPCTDSDNGKIYTIKGNTCTGTTCSTDACNSVGIVEYYCNNNQVDHENLSCGTGKTCSDGKCVAVTVTTTPTLVLGDYNGDRVVNLADFGIWKGKYLAVPQTMTLVEFGVWKRGYLGN